jgi:putative inorganic carbon (hco3(-)) transporter
VAWSAGKIGQLVPSAEERTTLAYGALLALSFIYFVRPEDYIPGLDYIPIAKIAGGISVFALVFGVSGQWKENKPKELRLVYLLYVWLILGLPFSSWHSKSIVLVFTDCLKCLVVAILVSLVVNTLKDLRRLLWMQCASVTASALGAILLHKVDGDGRLEGLGNGALFNPNDLAINIALNWPIIVMFFLASRNPFVKALWGIGLLAMIRAVMMTYSRSGFLALGMGIMIVLLEFGVRGGRRWMLVLPLVLAVPAVLLAPTNYGVRLESIVGTPQAGSLDRGSADARKELLIKSVEISLTHPLFGIGIGNFGSYSNMWMVTHNTYTEFSSEAGIPALVIFVLYLKKAFENLRAVRNSPALKHDEDLQLVASALWAGMAAYVVGAFFACTARLLYPYFMVGYTTALYKISNVRAEAVARVPSREPAGVLRPKRGPAPGFGWSG